MARCGAVGAVRCLVTGHVEIQSVAKSLVAVREGVGPQLLGNAQGADPGRGPGREGGCGKRFVEVRIVDRERYGGIGERLKTEPNSVESRRRPAGSLGSVCSLALPVAACAF